MTTIELLSEKIATARHREEAEFESLGVGTDRQIVLFGAGRLGRKVLIGLNKLGREVVAFADNDQGLHGSCHAGIPVMSPTDTVSRWGGSALFVVTTFLPRGGGIGSRIHELQALGCRRVANFLQLGWKIDNVLPHFGADLPSRLLVHAGEFGRVAELWSDERSRETFRQQLAWRLQADFGGSSSPEPDQYFPRDIIRPNLGESFVDGGAFDGDTLNAPPWHFARTIAIEPDPASAAKLRASHPRNTLLHEIVLGSTPGCTNFNGTGTMASSRSESGALEVRVATLDGLLAKEYPTFIKLDVEGDELDALRGGLETLKRTAPVVAVCVYHRPEDLWMIPLFLHEALPGHRKYLRAHAWDGFELVVYAVPPERCISTR